MKKSEVVSENYKIKLKIKVITVVRAKNNRSETIEIEGYEAVQQFR